MLLFLSHGPILCSYILWSVSMLVPTNPAFSSIYELCNRVGGIFLPHMQYTHTQHFNRWRIMKISVKIFLHNVCVCGVFAFVLFLSSRAHYSFHLCIPFDLVCTDCCLLILSPSKTVKHSFWWMISVKSEHCKYKFELS